MAVNPVPRRRDYPSFDEEYFEWVDILEAVDEATDSFVMIELGAGYGRWCARAAAAVRRKSNGRFQFVAVEAEPDHFRWIHDHFRDNGIDPAGHELIWAAVGAQPGFVPFLVGVADSWYGQAIAEKAAAPLPDVENRRRLKARSVLGRPPAASGSDNGVTWVPCVTLAEILAPYPRVDLIDIDVQGAEYEVLASAMDLLNRRVRRIHVGTHSTEIERQLRELFTDHHWKCVNDYPCQSCSQTPYGTIQFGDGVQTWQNAGVPAAATQLKPGKSQPAEELPLVQRLRALVGDLKDENRALKRRNAELRRRCRSQEGRLRARPSSSWVARLIGRWRG
jgi:FkbM family methyltransferase